MYNLCNQKKNILKINMATMWQINFKSINQKKKVDRSVAMVKNRETQQRQKN